MAKVTNYTPEQVTTLTEGYKGVDNAAEVAFLAAEVGKTPASVRAKLSNLGLYKTVEAAKGPGKGETKTDISEAIAAEAGLTEAEVEGLTKATKSALEKVLAALTNR